MRDVTVIGAGPTGLTAALLLKLAGVDVHLVDATAERSDKSRALALQPRSLELLAKLGLAQRLAQVGHPTPGLGMHVDGTRVLRVDITGSMPRDTAWGSLLFLSQVEIEQALEAALRAQGVEVDRPRALAGFDEHDTGVTLRWADGSTSETRWLIGADGAHSTVRHTLGLAFHGAPYDSNFLLGDVVVEADEDTDELQIFLGRSGITALFPLPGKRTRVVTTDPDPGESPADLTLAELQEKANHHARRGWTLSDPVWLARFRLHHRAVTEYRVGRAFLAGDAAHIHSPLGGQGMNTGIQDAWNLSWKLAMVVHGQAPDDLLDSYHAERQPVGQRLLQFTDRGFQAATEDAPWFTGLRNTLLPWIAPAVLTDATRARVVRFVSQLGIRYRHSPLNGEAVPDGPDAGDRFESPVFAGVSWWACASGTDPVWRARVEAFAKVYPWLQVVWNAREELPGPSISLVRPDGHLALRTTGPHLDPVAAYFAERGLVPGR